MPNFNDSPSQTFNPEQISLERLNQQLDWYDRRSKLNQASYKLLKTVTIAAAATIPVLTTAGILHGNQISAALGILIAVVEGIQQLNQYHANWISYRSSVEALNHEKYFYLAHAGPYLHCDNPTALLAERLESVVSQENANWFVSQAQHRLSEPAK